MEAEKYQKLKDLLDQHYSWPANYQFKFIVQKANIGKLNSLFKENKTVIRASEKGNYVSVTAEIKVFSSAEIVAIYQKAAEIPGIISL